MSGSFAMPRWFYAIIPFYAIQSTIGTFVKLYLLDLGGGVLSVSLASSAFNIALIPSAFIGGKLADWLGRRKPLLLLSAAGQLACVFSISVTRDITSIIVLFAAYSFFSSFGPTIFSLLLIDTVPKDRMGDGSTLSFRYTIYGSISGLTLGTLILTVLPLSAVAFLPIGFSILMLCLSLLVVRDPAIPSERQAIAFSPEALVSRLAHLPVLMLHIPKRDDFKIVVRSTRSALTRDIPLIMVTNSLFFLGANLFFTSYTPFLRANDISYLEITGLDLFITVINALASSRRFSGFSKSGNPGTIVEFLSLRAIAFLLGSIASLYFTGRPVIYVTLLLYLLIGMAYTNITIGMNALLYRLLPYGKQGGTLGVYSALNSIAMFLGSFLSGNLSYYLGYSVTFLLSSITLFGAASLFEWHFKPKRIENEEPY